MAPPDTQHNAPPDTALSEVDGPGPLTEEIAHWNAERITRETAKRLAEEAAGDHAASGMGVNQGKTV